MRRAFREVLVANAPLVAMVPADRFIAAGAVMDTPVRPFIVLRWLAPVSLDGGRFGEQVQVQVHDERGSYVRIDSILKLVQPVLEGVAQYVGSDGRITQCDYTGHSGDQENLDYGTNMKFSGWQVIGVPS